MNISKMTRSGLLVAPKPITNTYSMLFDGVNERVLIGNVPVLDFEYTDPFSISAWVKRTNYTNQHTIISKMQTASPFRGWSLSILSTDVVALILRNTVTTNQLGVLSTTTITDANHHHIFATYDGSGNASGVNIYIDDGAAENNISTDTLSATIVSSAPAYMGAFTGTAQYMQGNLDEIAVFNKECNSTEKSEAFSIEDIKYHSASAVNLAYLASFDRATWDGTNYLIPDRSTYGNRGQSENMEIGDKVSDVH